MFILYITVKEPIPEWLANDEDFYENLSIWISRLTEEVKSAVWKRCFRGKNDRGRGRGGSRGGSRSAFCAAQQQQKKRKSTGMNFLKNTKSKSKSNEREQEEEEEGDNKEGVQQSSTTSLTITTTAAVERGTRLTTIKDVNRLLCALIIVYIKYKHRSEPLLKATLIRPHVMACAQYIVSQFERVTYSQFVNVSDYFPRMLREYHEYAKEMTRLQVQMQQEMHKSKEQVISAYGSNLTTPDSAGYRGNGSEYVYDVNTNGR